MLKRCIQNHLNIQSRRGTTASMMETMKTTQAPVEPRPQFRESSVIDINCNMVAVMIWQTDNHINFIDESNNAVIVRKRGEFLYHVLPCMSYSNHQSNILYYCAKDEISPSSRRKKPMDSWGCCNSITMLSYGYYPASPYVLFTNLVLQVAPSRIGCVSVLRSERSGVWSPTIHNFIWENLSIFRCNWFIHITVGTRTMIDRDLELSTCEIHEQKNFTKL